MTKTHLLLAAAIIFITANITATLAALLLFVPLALHWFPPDALPLFRLLAIGVAVLVNVAYFAYAIRYGARHAMPMQPATRQSAASDISY